MIRKTAAEKDQHIILKFNTDCTFNELQPVFYLVVISSCLNIDPSLNFAVFWGDYRTSVHCNFTECLGKTDVVSGLLQLINPLVLIVPAIS